MLAPIQSAFNSGEVSSALYSRIDIDKYKSSLRTCRNFIVHSQGGASNRCGMEYIASARYADSMCVAQEFIFNQSQAYILEFGHKYVRFFTDGAQIQSSGSSYTVSTPYLEADLPDLRFESSADVIYITHQNYQTRTLTRYANTNWVLATYAPDDGPFMPENIDETSSLTVSAVSGTNVTMTVSANTSIDTTIKLLLHADGSDTSTTITDSSASNHICTAQGNAQLDTDQKVFGTASILFDGSGDYVTTPDSADWDFGNGDFSISLRFRVPSLPSSTRYGIYGQMQNVSSDHWYGHRLELFNDGSIIFRTSNLDDSLPLTSASGLIAANTWYDILITRNGNDWRLFIDGVIVASATDSRTITNSTGALEIGRTDDTTGTKQYFNGWIDEFTIIKGTAIETDNYTISTAAFSTLTVSATDFSFNSLHVGALFKLRHYVQGQTISQTFTSSTSSSSISCFTTWRLITHGTWTGKFNVEKSINNGTTWTVLRSFSSTNDFNANTSGTEDVDTNLVPFLIRITTTSFSSGSLNLDLTSDPFFQDGIVRVTSYTSPTSVLVTVLQTLASTSATDSWAEGSWSDFRGYPAVCRFFQDRLCFAASPSEPQTIWMSKTSNYTSFIRNSPLLDTDGITINLPSRQLNAINGLIAFKKLLAFTSSSVFSIGPVSGSALTPTSIQQYIEEYSGSAMVEQIVLGMEAIYVSVGNEIIKNLGYQFVYDNFIGNEANVLAKHLFEGYTIIKMAYQRNPNSIVWFVRNDGVLLSLTYMKEQNVVAWAHHDTDGDVESIAVIPGDNSDELWLVVNRDNGRFIERMEGRKQTSLTDHIFLDSYTDIDNSTAVVSSLSHLHGEIVTLVGDSVSLGTMTVSASGTLPMSSNYTSLQVGLSYNADFEALSINITLPSGNSFQNQIKVGNVLLRLINTRGGYIGPNSDTLHEAFSYDELNRANQIENKAVLGTTSNFSGTIRVPLGSGYETGGRFFYRQSDPYPVTIASIAPEIEIGDKVS